ncbi:MAG: hypothetical protein EOP34_00325 [Rickettsiales bacterium]|nr:MAG: hypothetical protein EOP34_00325 [Rickettsiales bacterium]
MKWTICWNFEYSLIDTLLVSGVAVVLFYTIISVYPFKVKIPLMSNNQQVTKRRNFLVGTSETTRPLTFKKALKNIGEES